MRKLAQHPAAIRRPQSAPQTAGACASASAAEASSAELCNLAGVCAARSGGHALADQWWRKAIEIDPGNAQAYFNLGLSHARRGQDGDAERYYRQAAALDPTHSGTHANLGLLLAKNRRDEEARQHYRQAVALDPRNASAYANLGMLWARCNRDDEAERCYRQTLALDPRNVSAHSNLGVLLAKHDQDDEAEHCYRQALAADAHQAETHTNLGLLLEKRGRTDEAESCHRFAIALRPAYAAAYSNLANLLASNGREDDAERCYRQALALDPCSAAAHGNLGVLLANSRRDTEAEACFRQAVALKPGYPLACLNLGFLLLGQGRYGEGWIHHEARYHPGLPDQRKFPFPGGVNSPLWQGEPLAGKSLLVWTEQGLGDQIQFCRYLPLLKEQGATRITLVCLGPLKPLMQTLEGVDTVLAADEAAGGVAPHDYWTRPLSIPLHAHTRLETIPAQLPYLRAAPQRAARWSQRLTGGGLRIGLVWKGNRWHSNDSDRSLPGLATLAPLWSVPGVRFLSLQKDSGEDEAQNPPAAQPLVHLGAEIADFADTAAIVEQLDLLICVDTAVAHLAGALAKPCWVLLPAYKTDWRWMQARSDTPWYPGVVRLFRQQARGDWARVMAEVSEALRGFSARHARGGQPVTICK